MLRYDTRPMHTEKKWKRDKENILMAIDKQTIKMPNYTQMTLLLLIRIKQLRENEVKCGLTMLFLKNI